jgi:hypothetical protein
MNHPLRNALVVEVEDLLAKMEIFEQRWSAGANLERVLIVRHRTALGRGQHRHISCRNLMQLAALAATEFLIVNRYRSGGFAVDGGLGRFGHEFSWLETMAPSVGPSE